MPKLPSLVEMLASGMHFGHQTSRWHPKMKPFIFGAKMGVHIMDLEKTQEMLQDALTTISGIVARGGIILLVGTKPQAKGPIRKYAEACDMPYVVNRWLGGTITNFGQIKQTLKRLKTLKDQREKGELKKYTKMEQLMLNREIEDMEVKFGGIQHLTRTPDALFVIDIRTEKTAVQEAFTNSIPVIALCDSNVNPEGIAKVIPGNDDAVKSIEMLCKLVCDAIKEGRTQAAKTSVVTRTADENKIIEV